MKLNPVDRYLNQLLKSFYIGESSLTLKMRASFKSQMSGNIPVSLAWIENVYEIFYRFIIFLRFFLP